MSDKITLDDAKLITEKLFAGLCEIDRIKFAAGLLSSCIDFDNAGQAIIYTSCFPNGKYPNGNYHGD